MIVDLLQKFTETLNSDLEIENIQKIKSYQKEYNDLLSEIQELQPDFEVSNSEHYESQIEQYHTKNKMLLDSIKQYEIFLKDLEQPLEQLQQHLEKCDEQIAKLEIEVGDDLHYFDLDIKLFKELGILADDNQIIVQQEHLKTFKRITTEDNPWDFLYEKEV
eukprot:NODE_387_length_9532_cov_0.176402.p7 type:complete len:162 gc:universal NODE_387_length_9532_cov_0.176402:8177-8662(+)